MAYLFTDIDNTIIFSHRHETNEKKVWVEKLNGKDQSFMTYKTYRFLSPLQHEALHSMTELQSLPKK